MHKLDLHPGQYVAVVVPHTKNRTSADDREYTKACVVGVDTWFSVEQMTDLVPSRGPITVYKQTYGTGRNGEEKILCNGSARGFASVAIAVEYTRPSYYSKGVQHPEETFWVPDTCAAHAVFCTWKRYEEWKAEATARKEEEKRKQREENKRQRLYEKELVQIQNAVQAKLSSLGIDNVAFSTNPLDEVYLETGMVVLDLLDLKKILDGLESAEYAASCTPEGDDL